MIVGFTVSDNFTIGQDVSDVFWDETELTSEACCGLWDSTVFFDINFKNMGNIINYLLVYTLQDWLMLWLINLFSHFSTWREDDVANSLGKADLWNTNPRWTFEWKFVHEKNPWHLSSSNDLNFQYPSISKHIYFSSRWYKGMHLTRGTDVSFADMPHNDLNWHHRHVIWHLDLCQRPQPSGREHLVGRKMQVLMLRLN